MAAPTVGPVVYLLAQGRYLWYWHVLSVNLMFTGEIYPLFLLRCGALLLPPARRSLDSFCSFVSLFNSITNKLHSFSPLNILSPTTHCLLCVSSSRSFSKTIQFFFLSLFHQFKHPFFNLFSSN
ncbi:hypothetical protein L873DRAFT_399503 [Choiromyces venosus 120613-1]|uniref:Uncharacterized protein n=1 Tax=Choiromyces venosus 120613-1 TaxID=1336337 RepID=A0A3N4J237_9PEZI|nr:hypothetical protein L873DRAFT_399503 [Choiromyces venosus 120613-1]